MKREFLKGLELTDDQIEKIMAEHGKTVADNLSKIAQKDKEAELINAQLVEANKTIKSYKDMDIDAIKTSAQEWETKAKQLEKDKEGMENNFLLQKELLKAETHDAELLEKAIDQSLLKYEDGKIKGLDAQLKDLRESKPFLFKQTEEKEKEPATDSRFKSFEPKGSSGRSKTETQTLLDSVFDTP